jgi:hypothetical protein
MVNTTIQIAMLDCQPYLSAVRVRVRNRFNVDTNDLQYGACVAGHTRTWLQEEMA